MGRVDSRVDRVGLALIAVEPNKRELLRPVSHLISGQARAIYRLHLPRVDLNDSNPRRDQLLSQRVRERPDRRLRGAVDAAARVGLAAGNAADVDDVAAAAVAALLEDGQDRLRHVDQAVDVGGEHGVDVLGGDLGGFGDAFDQATVVD